MSRRVSCLPSTDAAFRDAARDALAGIDRHADPDDIAGLLAALLRLIYPAIEVHRQEALARIFGDDVWYAYRDGNAFWVDRSRAPD